MMKPFTKQIIYLSIIFIIALVVRISVAYPSFSNPKVLLSRPDSILYINSALSLSSNYNFNTSIDSNTPSTKITPGFPFFLAILFKLSHQNYKLCAFVLCIIGALTCIPIFFTATNILNPIAGYIASLLFALNITAIALSPLFLTDTLFTFFISITLYYFIKFYKSQKESYLYISVFLSALAIYVRPTNYVWIFFLLLLICFLKNYSFKRKIINSVICFFIFFSVIFPWLIRNQKAGIGYEICSNVENTLLYYNCSVLLGKVRNESSLKIRRQLQIQTEKEFNKNPEKYKTIKQRNEYKKNLAFSFIKKYPITYLKLHFRPSILIPDAPNFFQNLRLTIGGKGTFDVLNKDGILAAITHYFAEKIWLILLISPLLIIVGITYLFSFSQIIIFIINRNWYMILASFCFIFYYLIMPGPITMPRYQLPALPFICILASIGMINLYKYLYKQICKLYNR